MGTGQEGWIWFSLGKKGNENTQNWTQTGHTKVTVAQSDREPGLSAGEQGSAWHGRTHCGVTRACQRRLLTVSPPLERAAAASRTIWQQGRWQGRHKREGLGSCPGQGKPSSSGGRAEFKRSSTTSPALGLSVLIWKTGRTTGSTAQNCFRAKMKWNKAPRAFPGGSVVKNAHASAGGRGSISHLGRSHKPRSN